MIVCSAAAWSSHSRSSSRSSLDEMLTAQPRLKDSAASSTTSSAKSKPPLDYNHYMGCLLPKQPAVGASASCPVLQSLQSSPGAEKKVSSLNCFFTNTTCLIVNVTLLLASQHHCSSASAQGGRGRGGGHGCLGKRRHGPDLLGLSDGATLGRSGLQEDSDETQQDTGRSQTLLL